MLPSVGCFRISGGGGNAMRNFAFGLKARIRILRLHFPRHIQILYFLYSRKTILLIFLFGEISKNRHSESTECYYDGKFWSLKR